MSRWAITLCLALPLAAQETAVVTPASEAASKLQEVTNTGLFQTKLPAAGEAADQHRNKPRSGSKVRPDELREPLAAEPFLLPTDGWLSRWISYALVASVVLGLLWTLQRRRSAVTTIRTKVAKGTAAAADPALRPAKPTAAAASQPSQDPAELAAAGQYREAVHALQLQALKLLADRRGKPWPVAQTNREILREIGGLGAGDHSLASLFAVAEAAWFGQRAIAQEDYEDCATQLANWRQS